MGKENVKTVLNKKYGLSLVKMGFPLVNVEVSAKNPGEVTFFFQESEEIETAFSALINANKIFRSMNGLELKDIEIILKVLQNYDITDEERFPVMEKVQHIIDLVYDVKPYTTDESKTIEEVVELNIDDLKKSMSGCK